MYIYVAGTTPFVRCAFTTHTGVTTGHITVPYVLPIAAHYTWAGQTIKLGALLKLAAYVNNPCLLHAAASIMRAGVTTGPVTVPFVLAIGIGFSKAVGASEGFGMVSLHAA
jgi:hypothetical protein